MAQYTRTGKKEEEEEIEKQRYHNCCNWERPCHWVGSEELIWLPTKLLEI